MNTELPARISNYIGGNLDLPLSGRFLPKYNPATGKPINELPDSDESDVNRAVEAATKALPEWKNMPAEKRFRILNRIADLIEENLEMLALTETNDNGKPLWLSRQVEIPRASANFRFFASAALQFSSESHSMEELAIN